MALAVQVGAEVVVMAMFGGIAYLLVVPALLALLVLILAWLARTLIGRASWAGNMVIVALAVAVSVLLYAQGVPAVLFGGADVAPLIVGVAAAAMSLVLHRGRVRVLGACALITVVVALAVPLVQDQLARQRAAEAAEEEAFQRVLEASLRPYTVPGYAVRSALFGPDSSRLTLSDDPGAPRNDDHEPDEGDLVVETSHLWTLEDLDAQVCGPVVDPQQGGTGSCTDLGGDVWMLEVGGAPAVVRVLGDRKVTLSGAGDLRALALDLVLLERQTFEAEFRQQQDRNDGA